MRSNGNISVRIISSEEQKELLLEAVCTSRYEAASKLMA